MIAGKWLAALVLYFACCCDGVRLWFVFKYGHPDWKPILVAYLGMFCKPEECWPSGCLFLAHQEPDHRRSFDFAACLVLWCWMDQRYETATWAQVLSYMSVTTHMSPSPRPAGYKRHHLLRDLDLPGFFSDGSLAGISSVEGVIGTPFLKARQTKYAAYAGLLHCGGPAIIASANVLAIATTVLHSTRISATAFPAKPRRSSRASRRCDHHVLRSVHPFSPGQGSARPICQPFSEGTRSIRRSGAEAVTRRQAGFKGNGTLILLKIGPKRKNQGPDEENITGALSAC